MQYRVSFVYQFVKMGQEIYLMASEGNGRKYNVFLKLTNIPKVLSKQQPDKRLTYRIRPFRRYGQATFAARDGAILQNNIIPLGVDGGTRSKAAESIMT